jgi:hypothetical protein
LAQSLRDDRYHISRHALLLLSPQPNGNGGAFKGSTRQASGYPRVIEHPGKNTQTTKEPAEMSGSLNRNHNENCPLPRAHDRKCEMAKTASILMCALAASTFSFNAQAFPSVLAPLVAASDVIQVRGFCGLGAHRGPYGYCVPNGVVVVAPPAYYVAPPVAVMPSVVCPYGYYYYAPYGRCVPTP